MGLLIVAALFVGCGESSGGDGGCQSNAECGDGYCINGECVSYGGNGNGSGSGGCATDAQCDYSLVCRDGQCVEAGPQCVSDGDCVERPGGSCVVGRCVYDGAAGGCEKDEDCPEDEVCDLVTGECVEGVRPECTADADCDDGDSCTVDACAADGCTHEAIPGCCTTAADCDDRVSCTADSCENNVCRNEPIPDCCTTAADCDDDNDCTMERCDGGACVYNDVAGCCEGARDCDDGDVCTTDRCTSQGCVHEDIPGCCERKEECDDGNVCTEDTCEANACVHTPLPGECCSVDADCNDGNLCTTDSCTADGQCRNEPIDGCCMGDADCDDGDPCTRDVCAVGTCDFRPVAECCVADRDCDDGDPCTADRCVGNRCEATAQGGCCATDTECDDGIPLTVDLCVANACQHSERVTCTSDGECEDGEMCTVNTCEGGRCSVTLNTAPACRCESQVDCDPDGQVCSLEQLPNDGGIWTYCADPVGTVRMGAECSRDADCITGTCLELLGTSVCFGACATDLDCAGASTCREVDFPSGGSLPDHPVDLCVPPYIYCSDDGDCPSDMYCSTFATSDDPSTAIQGCLYGDETLARTGEPCDGNADCMSGYCITDTARGGICWGMCDSSNDCESGQRCYDGRIYMTLDMGTTTTSDDRDVDLPACMWDVGSLESCVEETDCAASEVCYPLLNDTDDGFAPICIIPLEDTTTAPGHSCTTDAQCQTGNCVTGGASSGVCLMFCDTWYDLCPGSASCETVTFTVTDENGGGISEFDADVCYP